MALTDNYRVSVYINGPQESVAELAKDVADLVKNKMGGAKQGKLYVTLSEVKLPPDYQMFIKGLLEDSVFLLTADDLEFLNE